MAVRKSDEMLQLVKAITPDEEKYKILNNHEELIENFNVISSVFCPEPCS